MKKYLSKAMAYAAMLLMTTVFYACKDDDGPSADTFIGVWEGVEADSWSILPGYVEDGWWAEEPDKNEKYGVDISDYRIEFTADKFYRIYREVVASNPRDNKWSMAAYGKWSNSGNTITLTSYDSSDKTYNEESPENFRIVELDKDELILEYHENRPDGENYGKITLRQIADKGDIYEEEVKEDDNKDENEDSGKPIKNEDLMGEWIATYYCYEYPGEDPDEIDYDFNDYSNDQIKLEIKDATNNELLAFVYFYNYGSWDMDPDYGLPFKLSNNKVIDLDDKDWEEDGIKSQNSTMSLKGDELTIKHKTEYYDGDEEEVTVKLRKKK